MGHELVVVVLSIAAFCALARIVQGPSVADRVVALDLILTIAIGYIAVAAIDTGHSILLDAALVLALISFLGTVAVARYVEKGGRPHDARD